MSTGNNKIYILPRSIGMEKRLESSYIKTIKEFSWIERSIFLQGSISTLEKVPHIPSDSLLRVELLNYYQ